MMILIILCIMIVTIPVALVLYFFWKRDLKTTIVSDGVKLALYEQAGRKMNLKTTKYYFNPYGVTSISGGKVTLRRRSIFIIFALFLYLGTIIDFAVIYIAIIALFLFMVIVEKSTVTVYNFEFLEDNTIQTLADKFNVTRLKSTGNVSPSELGSLVFGGNDDAAEDSIEILRNNFDLYVDL